MKHRGKRALSILLALTLLLSLIVLPAAAEGWDGSTVSEVTEQDGIFAVSTGAELAWIAQQVNAGNDFAGKTIRLTENIDLGNRSWTPIGQAEVSADGVLATGNAFAGTFDGNGKTISNLYASDANGGVALFGYTTGSIKDLTVSGAVFGNHYTAGIAAVGQGTFSGVTNQVNVTAEGNCFGGVLGDATGNVTFADCHNRATITNNNSSAEKSTGRIGGIVGRVETGCSGSITNCSNAGNITGYQYVGGIVGGCFGNVSIQGCYNTGHLTGISFGKVYLGGIVGKLENGTVSNCYNWGDLDVNCWAAGHTRFAAGIVGSEEDHPVGTAVTNCYSIGTINVDTSKKILGTYFVYSMGGVAGGDQATAESTMSYENCFYLSGCIPSQDPAHESYPYWCDVWKNNPKAYDTDNIIAKTVDELKSADVLAALGSYFRTSDSGYPVLYWQTGSEAPPAKSYTVLTSISGGTASIETESSLAQEGSTVSFAITDLESGKRIRNVAVTDNSGSVISCSESGGVYSFTMPSRAVTISVQLENTVADDAESYAIALPGDLDAIWNVRVESSYYEDGKVKAGALVTVIVEKNIDAMTSSFSGITVYKTEPDVQLLAVTEVKTASANGSKYYGEYRFTMPEAAVEVSLNAAYSDLKVYVKQDGVSTLQKSLSRSAMETLADQNGRGYYSGWSSETQPFIGVAEQYVTLEQVLSASGIALESGDSVSVVTPDGFVQNYTYAQLTADRYYYSDILSNRTAAESAAPFGYALILKGNMAYTEEETETVVCDTLCTYRFVYGQTESELKNATKCVDTMPKCIVGITVNRAAPGADTSWYNIKDATFTLTTASQLYGLAEIVNGTAMGIAQDDFAGRTIRLGNDIALAEDGLYRAIEDVRYGTASYAIVTTQYVLDAAAPVWTPIGSGSATTNTNASGSAFAGTFDGRGFTISGIYTGTKDANTANTDTVQGLFGIVTGTVKNLTVSGCITAKSVAGGVVAHLNGGTVENCVNKAIVFADGGTTPNGNTEDGTKSAGAVGGIVGNAMTGSVVVDCVNNAPITCANSKYGGRTGGIIGLIDDINAAVTVTRNANNGVIDSYQYAGGIVGMNFGKYAPIESCCNTGRVWAHSGGQSYAGGIASYSYSDIKNCYNTGEVGVHQQGNANDKCAHFGGIVSDFLGSAITNCYNIGQLTWSVTGVETPLHTSQGGICGTGYGSSVDTSKLVNCYTVVGTAYENEGYTTEKSAEEMKQLAALLGDAFVKDAALINSGYPILAWQGTSPICTVTLPVPNSDDGYEIYRISESNQVQRGETFQFAVAVSEEYQLKAVMAGGVELTAYEANGWFYFSFTVTEDTVVTVEVEKKGGKPEALIWDGETIDVRWFTDNPYADSFYISYPAEFAGLAALVNGIYNEEIKYIWGDESYIRDLGGSGGTGGNNESTLSYHYGAYNFGGKTVYLCADIDMGSANNYMPIGGQYLMTDEDTSTKISAYFIGVLDGQGHDVTIYCNRHCSGNYGDGQSVGLIGLLGSHDNESNSTNPAVRNLAVYGSVKGNRSVGGIVGKIGNKKGGDVTIENCANFAAVYGTDAKGTGGIVGAAWNGGVIQNCYNAGSVTSTYTNAMAGIAGSCEINVINCYNVGKVTASNSTAAAIASNNGGSIYTNCYWLTGSADLGVYGSSTTGVTEKSSAEMKADTFVLSLGDAFHKDSKGINNGYPILAWQGGTAVKEKLYTTTVINGVATTTIDSEVLIKTLKELGANGQISIAADISAGMYVYKTVTVLSGDDMTNLANAGASLVVSSPLADIKLSKTALKDVANQKGGVITISAASGSDDETAISVAVDEGELDTISGGLSVTLPVAKVTERSVLVMVADDGTETILENAVFGSSWVTVTVSGSCVLRVREKNADVLSKTVIENGVATVIVDSDKLKELLETVDKNTILVIAANIPEGKTVNEVTTQLPASDMKAVADSGASLKVETPIANVTLSNEALSDLSVQKGDVAVSALVGEETGTVTIEVAVGGKTQTEISGGITVAVPVKNATTTSVLVIVHEDGAETIVKKSVSGKDNLTALLAGSATIKVVDNSKKFNDVEDHWGKDAIGFVSSRELFQGVGDDNFAPNNDMSRAMLVTVLHRLEDEAEHNYEGLFEDVAEGTWYTDAVRWAADKGIVTGYGDGTYGTNDSISREQLATMLYRYAQRLDMDTTVSGELNEYSDGGETSPWALEAMRWAVGSGIIAGNGDGTVSPGGNANRAQVATMLQRLIGMMVK